MTAVCRCLVAVAVAAYALASAPVAHANGRRPTPTDVRFHPADDDWVLAAVTFGFLLSTDGGATFEWVCEDAACPGDGGFNGCDTFDPVYAIRPDGTIFNTTIFGMHVSRDGGCTFAPVGGPLDGRFVGDIAIDRDGVVWAVTSDGASPNDVYRSADGSTFAQRNLHIDTGWFDTIRVAPSDPNRVYVSGWVPPQPDGSGGFSPAQTLLFRSNDGGATWTAVTPAGLPAEAKLFVEVVDRTNPDVVLARVPGDPDVTKQSLYRSTNAGATWSRVLSLTAEVANQSDPPGRIRVTQLDDGRYLAGSPLGGLHRSTNGGATWAPVAVSPRVWCVRQRGDGALFACSENWDPDMELDPSVRAAVVRSADGGDSWTPVMRFSQIVGPKQCPAGTAQAEICAGARWCTLAAMFGIDPGPACGGSGGDAGPSGDGGPGGDGGPRADAGSGGGGGTCGCSLAFASALFVIPRRRRRRRRRT